MGIVAQSRFAVVVIIDTFEGRLVKKIEQFLFFFAELENRSCSIKLIELTNE